MDGKALEAALLPWAGFEAASGGRAKLANSWGRLGRKDG